MKSHAINILELAVEVAKLGREALLEGLQFWRDVRRFLEEHI